MGHWAMPCLLWQWRMSVLTCDRCPICAVRQLTSLSFSSLEGLGWASAPSSSTLHVSLKAQEGSAQEESILQWWILLMTSLPLYWSCPRQAPDPCPLGAAGDDQKSRLRAQSHAQVSNRPLGQSGLEALEIHRLTWPQFSSRPQGRGHLRKVLWAWSRVGVWPRGMQ